MALTRLTGLLGGSIMLLGLVACGETPPPPPPPQPTAVPEPEPPPPPKCEAIKEGCKADKDTTAPVPETDYVFSPPKGWVYAKLEEATVTQKGDEGAVLVFLSVVPEKNKKKRDTQMNELRTSFSELVLIDKPGSTRPTKTDKGKLAGLDIEFKEYSDAKRGKDDGFVLTVTAPADDREIFGLAFAPVGDTPGTEAIKGAIASLKKKEK